MKKIDFNQDWSYRYNDGEKIPVMLPHDAMLHSPRSANSPGTNANGFFEGGVYTYEKEWFVPADWKDKSVMLEETALWILPRKLEVACTSAERSRPFL